MSEGEPRVSIILATYNERENILDTVRGIFEHVKDPVEVIVVDDDSPDGTWHIAGSLGDPRVKVIRRVATRGLASAFNRGIIESRGEVVGWMDADMCMPPAMLPAMIDRLADHDIVIGSRYVRGVNVINWPMSRLILSYGANVYTRIITGMPVRDATGGFKCFRRAALEAIDFGSAHSDGYSFQIEMNYRCWRKGLRIREVPIVFVDRFAGTSKMSKRIIWEAIWMVWRLRIASILGYGARR